uniref:Uncharacterized protein n=1 Tax=Arundo donax TaxID=35708 RepID=A0A0A9GNR3_ARUDO
MAAGVRSSQPLALAPPGGSRRRRRR